MFLRDQKLIFLHIPKCAGTSVEQAFDFFEHYQGWERQDHRTYREMHPVSWRPGRFGSRSNLIETAKRLIKKRPNPKANIYPTRSEFEECEVFAIIRNPYTRAFSWYKNVISDKTYWDKFDISAKTSFSEFLERFLGRDSLRTQMHWLMDFDGKLPDHVHLLRFECLDAQLSAFFDERDIQVTLGHELQSSSEVNNKLIFDDDAKALIKEFFATDFEQLSYSDDFAKRYD